MNASRWHEPAKWVVFLSLIVLCGWFLDWNENRSPWGLKAQAIKTELLKRQLCN